MQVSLPAVGADGQVFRDIGPDPEGGGGFARSDVRTSGFSLCRVGPGRGAPGSVRDRASRFRPARRTVPSGRMIAARARPRRSQVSSSEPGRATSRTAPRSSMSARWAAVGSILVMIAKRPAVRSSRRWPSSSCGLGHNRRRARGAAGVGPPARSGVAGGSRRPERAASHRERGAGAEPGRGAAGRRPRRRRSWPRRPASPYGSSPGRAVRVRSRRSPARSPAACRAARRRASRTGWPRRAGRRPCPARRTAG